MCELKCLYIVYYSWPIDDETICKKLSYYSWPPSCLAYNYWSNNCNPGAGFCPPPETFLAARIYICSNSLRLSCQLSSFCYIRAPVEVFILQRERAVTWLYSLYAVRTSYAVFTEVTVQEKVALYYRLFRKTELLAENPSGSMNSGLKNIFVFLFYRVILIYSSYFDILYSTSSGRPLLRGANRQRQDKNFRT